MIQKHKLFLLLVIFPIFSASIFSQTENDGVDFKISLADGKKVYRIGEPIRVVLTFTVKQPGYTIRMNSGAATDKIVITPTDGIYEWKAKRNLSLYDVDDNFNFLNDYSKPVNITIALNDSIRFDKAGKYSINITSNRIFYTEQNPKKRFDFGKPQPSITANNSLDFEVTEMNQNEEKAEIKRLLAEIEARKANWRDQDKYVQELAFLTGDASTVEKVRQYLHPVTNNGNFSSHIHNGLFIARNKTLAIKLLEDALHDLNREDNYSVIHLLTSLRMFQENEFNPAENNKTDFKNKWEQINKRSAEIRQVYLNELIESLPKRTGNNLTSTAITIFTQLPREDVSSEAFNTTKTIILNNFDELNPYQQNQLLESSWEKLKTPALIPSLEKILSRKMPVQYLNNSTPLKRLIELDKLRARPFVVAEIQNPQSFVDIEVLGALDDKTLPEIDDAILAQISELGQIKNGNRDNVLLRIKALVAARYATAKIYKPLMEVYKTNSDKWFEDSRISLLGYFAQHNEKEAVQLIEERLNKLGKGGLSNITYSLTKVKPTKGIEKLFSKYLESEDSQNAGTAVYYLSKFGGKENRKLIENRYNRWLKQWKSRAEEFKNTELDSPIRVEIGFQSNVISSMLNAKSWKLTEKEIADLKETCLSEDCLRYFPK